MSLISEPHFYCPSKNSIIIIIITPPLLDIYVWERMRVTTKFGISDQHIMTSVVSYWASHIQNHHDHNSSGKRP